MGFAIYIIYWGFPIHSNSKASIIPIIPIIPISFGTFANHPRRGKRGWCTSPLLPRSSWAPWGFYRWCSEAGDPRMIQLIQGWPPKSAVEHVELQVEPEPSWTTKVSKKKTVEVGLMSGVHSTADMPWLARVGNNLGCPKSSTLRNDILWTVGSDITRQGINQWCQWSQVRT